MICKNVTAPPSRKTKVDVGYLTSQSISHERLIIVFRGMSPIFTKWERNIIFCPLSSHSLNLVVRVEVSCQNKTTEQETRSYKLIIALYLRRPLPFSLSFYVA